MISFDRPALSPVHHSQVAVSLATVIHCRKRSLTPVRTVNVHLGETAFLGAFCRDLFGNFGSISRVPNTIYQTLIIIRSITVLKLYVW
jgi:hypothetical protein